MQTTCPKEHFEGKCCFCIFFHELRTLIEEVPCFFQTIFKGVVKTAFYLSIVIFWGKTVFSENNTFFNQLRTFGNSVLTLCKKTVGSPIKNEFYLSLVFRTNLTKKIFFEKIVLFNRFRTLSEFLLTFFRKILTELSKLRSTCPYENFDWKFFFDFFVHHFHGHWTNHIFPSAN